ncbi:MAG: 30S ribosome-binding factor RbfA [Gemmatimonadetes bacterium]|nr:30S ribosome-binding factor RbfA [Gemmatimonadota bacterium]MYB56123.1 30S ribosome-binding factor RbfA [Gemmatimonadota bacterium]
MPSYRPESVGKAIQVALSEILHTETRDPGLSEVTITAVTMSRDLRTARVYISVMSGSVAQTEALECLMRAISFLRRALAQRVQLRHVPELVFAWDDSITQGARIEQLLNNLNT